jgi:hypothetical protein
MHPVIDEICRIPHGQAVRSDVLRRWQSVLRHEVSPLIEQGDRLASENAELRKELEALKVKRGKA